MEIKKYVLDKDSLPYFDGLYPGKIEQFSDDSHFAVGLVIDEEPAGLFLSTFAGEDLFLDWIYLDPKFRGNKIGLSFYGEIMRSIREAQQINHIYAMTADKQHKYLLQDLGFIFLNADAKPVYSSTLSKIIDFPKMEPSSNITHLCEMKDADIKGLNQFLHAQNNFNVTVSFPIKKEDYLKESLIYWKDGEPKSVILFVEDGDSITIPFSFKVKNGSKYLGHLLTVAKEELLKTYGPDKEIYITAVNEDSESVTKKLFTEYETSYIYVGVR